MLEEKESEAPDLEEKGGAEEETEAPGDDGGVNEVQQEPPLTPEMMRSLLHILLTAVKGITIPQKTFDEYDAKATINMSFDGVNNLWRFWVTPSGTGIVVPRKRPFRKHLRIIHP
jgi:hypothetical protein